MEFSLTSRSDHSALRAGFTADGSISIPRFLGAEEARALATELTEAEGWVEIFRAGEKVYEMPQPAYAALDDDKKSELQRIVEDAARRGLQYRYRAIRVSEDSAERAARASLVDRFTDFMNAPNSLDFFRSVTGRDDIAFVDAQATDYRAGDFLTTHDDAVEGKHRVAAYVFSLTPHWQADWGGLLMFEDGERVSGFIPDFNVLRLFAVPRRHHVSYVVPWAGERRLSITGWLRSAGPGE